jgi:hypothetical protein
LRDVDRLPKAGHTYVVYTDLKSYFDAIPHDRLMALVEGRSAMAGFCPDRRLPATGDHVGDGAVAAGDGNDPRGGAVVAAGEPVSAPACSEGSTR